MNNLDNYVEEYDGEHGRVVVGVRQPTPNFLDGVLTPITVYRDGVPITDATVWEISINTRSGIERMAIARILNNGKEFTLSADGDTAGGAGYETDGLIDEIIQAESVRLEATNVEETLREMRKGRAT